MKELAVYKIEQKIFQITCCILPNVITPEFDRLETILNEFDYIITRHGIENDEKA